MDDGARRRASLDDSVGWPRTRGVGRGPAWSCGTAPVAQSTPVTRYAGSRPRRAPESPDHFLYNKQHTVADSTLDLPRVPG